MSEKSGSLRERAAFRVTLRPFTRAEYHVFFRNYEPDLSTSAPFSYNREQIDRSYDYNHGGFQQGYAHFGVFNEADEPVGSFQLKRMDPKTGKGEFGIILLNERTRGLGLGPEAIRLGMDIARERFGLETLWGDTMSCNERMRRVFLKLGFSLMETVPSAFTLRDGRKADRLVYAIRL